MNSQIQFEDSYNFDQSTQEKSRSNIEKLVKKYSGGIIKTDQQVYLFLVIFIIVSFLFSFFLITRDNSEAEITAPPGYRVVYPDDSPPYIQPISE